MRQCAKVDGKSKLSLIILEKALKYHVGFEGLDVNEESVAWFL